MDTMSPRHVERQACRMREMLERLDVDPLKLIHSDDGNGYPIAHRNCLDCIDARECLHWLDAGAARGHAPTFCPNLERFRTCKRS